MPILIKLSVTRMELWTGVFVLEHCPGGNATEPIWRVLASSDGISSWTPLKSQHSNPNPNLLANQLWCIDFLTPPTPLIIPHSLPAFLESLMPLKNWCSIHARWSKSSLNQLWQSYFSWVYSYSCCSCAFEAEIIKIGQSSHKLYSNNRLNFQESTTILNAYTKKSGNLLNVLYIYIYIYMVYSISFQTFLYRHLIYIYIYICIYKTSQ